MAKTPQYKKQIINICTHNHITANEIYEQLKKDHPSIGLATVYRNLKKLVQEGKLKKFQGMDDKAIYEADIGLHAHLIDQETGKIKDKDIDDDILENIDLPEDTKKVDIRIYHN